MLEDTVQFASPKVAKALTKATRARVDSFTVSMRESRDVPKFLKKLEKAHQNTAKSRLHFGTSK